MELVGGELDDSVECNAPSVAGGAVLRRSDQGSFIHERLPCGPSAPDINPERIARVGCPLIVEAGGVPGAKKLIWAGISISAEQPPQAIVPDDRGVECGEVVDEDAVTLPTTILWDQ